MTTSSREKSRRERRRRYRNGVAAWTLALSCAFCLDRNGSRDERSHSKTMLAPLSPVAAWTQELPTKSSRHRTLTLPFLLIGGQKQQTVLSLSSAAADAAPISSSTIHDSSTSSLRELYPPSTNISDCRYENGTVTVENGFHTLFYQVYSNPNYDAIAAATNARAPAVALFLHGGPGAGCSSNHARFFDPQRYSHVILLDQRGCGKSTAKDPAKLHHFNTIRHLVDDIETLRRHLHIDQFTTILGGSWGTTLALAYAQEYPERVYGLVLRGVCTMRQSEVDWLFADGGGASKLFPESFRKFQEAVMSNSDTLKQMNASVGVNGDSWAGEEALEGYYNAFFSPGDGVDPNRINATTAAQSWKRWEFLMSMAHKLLPALESPAGLNISDQSAVMKALHDWDANHTESPVAVGTKETWAFHDGNSNLISTGDNPEKLPQHYRQRIKVVGDNLAFAMTTPPTPESLLLRSINVSAQVLLTCQYSYNRDFCMCGWNLLDPTRMQRLQHIRCIAIQGGTDLICPPDTALDLLEAWPTSDDAVVDKGIELRMPLYAGHSMYDSFLTNELVRATDRIADEWTDKERGKIEGT